MKKLTTLLVLPILGIIITGFSTFGQSINTNSKQTIFHEEFNYPIGQIPTDWQLIGTQTPWKVSNSMLAGGDAPELFLGYSMADGDSRLVSTPVAINGFDGIRFKIKQYLINYEMDFGEIIGMDYTFDGGETWNILWEKAIGTLNIPPDDYEYYISIPSGVNEMQYAFRYQGNSFAINMWVIDDVILETVENNDLVCMSISGTNTPIKGQESVYTIEIQNGGILTQSNYTVKLMTEEGIELASANGIPISFSEKQSFELSWTPEFEVGKTNIYGLIEFLQDENPSNNQTQNLSVNILDENTLYVSIGNENTPVSFLPFNFFSLHNISQTLYYPEEIGVNSSKINGLMYTGHFDSFLEGVQITVKIGETEITNLSENWVTPSSLTLVFDSVVEFHKGLNHVFFAFSNSFQYNGGNLVIQTTKSYPEMVIGVNFFNTLEIGSARTRASESDTQAFDPQTIPEFSFFSDYYPNIRLFYNETASSLDDIQTERWNFRVFPNPAKEVFHIQAEEEIKELTLYNGIGQVVYQSKPDNKNCVVYTNQLDAGFYLLQISTSKKQHSQKIIISK